MLKIILSIITKIKLSIFVKQLKRDSMIRFMISKEEFVIGLYLQKVYSIEMDEGFDETKLNVEEIVSSKEVTRMVIGLGIFIVEIII